MEGWQGWDEYAPFYDWENAQTMGRRDVRFWQNLARRIGGRVLELGCGTGRISIPVSRTGVQLVGVDRSTSMLAGLRRRLKRSKAGSVALVRGDIRLLPFRHGARFDLVMAPYGILQSLLSDEDLTATLQSVASVIAPGGTFGLDLVSDLPVWKEYTRRPRLRGRRGSTGPTLTLYESVRQDRRRGLTIFDQEYVETRGGSHRRQRFSLTFRTVSVADMHERLTSSGFEISAVLGDYDGRAWDPRADTWLLIAKKR
jgi:SAM-dependent methyltransferase